MQTQSLDKLTNELYEGDESISLNTKPEPEKHSLFRRYFGGAKESLKNLAYTTLIPLAFMVGSKEAEAITHYVNPWQSIQSKIDDPNVVAGDEIIVAQGRYYENINFNGKNITLKSTDPNYLDVIVKTIIDGSLGGSVVTFAGTESPACVLSGFTITNGRGTGVGPNYGGGIYGNGTLATIQYNIISGNRTASPLWPNSGFGGGLYDCDGTIQYNIILKNLASGNEGVALGGGLYGCDGKIQNNVISGNRASGQHSSRGGGLYDCDGIIQNNTIFGNLAGYGGGLSDCNGTIINCIIWQNTANQASQLYLSNIPSYSCIQDWSSGGIGNISDDPCFVSLGYWEDKGTPNPGDDFWVDGDYHLKSQGWRWDNVRQRWDYDSVTSRCIDAGNPSSPLEDELLSVPDDPNNIWGKNIRINMGVYGGTKEASMPSHDWALLADLTNDGIVNLKDFAVQTKYWLTTENKQPGDMNRDGTTNTADLALLAKDYLKQTIWYKQ